MAGPAINPQYTSPQNQQSPGSLSTSLSHHDGFAGSPGQRNPKDQVEGDWSADDSNGGSGQDSSRKRKRPMSVSLETYTDHGKVIEASQAVVGACETTKSANIENARNQVCEQVMGENLKLVLILQTQQSAITQLTNNAINGGAAPTATSHEQPVFKSPPPPLPQTPHVPRPETALFLQKPSTFPTQPSPIEYGNVFNGNTTQPNGFQQLPSVSEGLRPPSLPGLPPTPRELYTPGQPPVPSLGSPTLNVPGAAPGVHNDHSTVQDEKLPSYDLLYALVDLYFRHINTWCPILHRRSTLDSLFGGSALDEADRILLHAIVATTLRFSTDERLTPESRARYHSLSKQKVLLYGLENSSVKALQALVILALDLVGASNGPPGWNLLALITRSVVQLGLAVEATSASVSPNYPSIYTIRAMVLPEAKDFIEDESRRRLFWMVYILDRYATIATAFEFALDEKEIDRKLPCRDDLFGKNQAVETRWFKTEERSRPDERPELTLNKPENLGAFSHYVEIIGIMSRIHLFLKKPVDIGALADVEQWQKEYRALDSLINDWKYSLPTEFEEIASLCNYVKSNALLPKLGPPFAFSVWVAARLLLVHGSTIEHQVNSSIHLFVDTLRDMGGFWHVAERYAALLQRVLEEYRESESGPPGANGERETPSTVRILADMRRCAYDLDWLISRQPKQQQQQQQQHTAARLASATPAARTPAPNELEYLDVFDFFNMPRLPAQTDGPMANGSGSGVENVATEAGAIANEFNITNFMVDVNSDWFMKNPA
ncbi:MAG: hypothetical protein Q9157_004489 [Trypethelium eluteriae]